MLKQITYQPLVILLLAILFACNPQSKLVKQAQVQSSAGMYEDAANLYYNILLTDRNNKEARAGLQLNGQKVLADKFAKFSKQVIEGKIEEALNTYHYASGYAQNSAKVGVVLDWPAEYDEVYTDIRQEYTQNQYDIAVELIRSRKYEQAEKVFERIAIHDTSYKNVSVLRLNTVLDPLYNKGLQQYKAGQFKEAYYTFTKVTQIDDQYKDAVKLRNQSQQQATSLVGILPVYYYPAAKEFQGTYYNIAEKVADALSKQQGAYVRISNTSTFHKDLANRGFVNINSASKAIEAGKSTNMAYAVLIEMDSFSYQKSKPQLIEREAFEAVTENILNPYTNTYSSISKFKKAKYMDKTEGQSLFIRVSYQLIDVRSAVVIYSDTLSLQKTDELHAASYEGNPANLYPNLPESNYLPHVSAEWRQMFSNPRKTLIPLTILVNNSVEEVSEKIVRSVQQKL